MRRRQWTPIKIKPCRECGKSMLRGDIDREVIRADSMPLTIQAQTILAQKGRRLYEIRLGDRMELFPYAPERIHGSVPAIVVTDHTCVEWPDFAIDRAANERLYDYHHPDPPPQLFQPPF